jgi:hypothetical protein
MEPAAEEMEEVEAGIAKYRYMADREDLKSVSTLESNGRGFGS